jgi:hypothetical protein
MPPKCGSAAELVLLLRRAQRAASATEGRSTLFRRSSRARELFSSRGPESVEEGSGKGGEVRRHLSCRALLAAVIAIVLATPATPSATAAEERITGYWMLDAGGQVTAFGSAPYSGSPTDLVGRGMPSCTIPDVAFCWQSVDLEPNPAGDGYWTLDTLGFLAWFGEARPFEYGFDRRAVPWVDLEATPAGDGLWAFGADGCIGLNGTAGFHGSMCDRPLAAPIVAAASTPSGRGYLLLAADGGIFTFGDAAFFGSTGAMRLNQPVVSFALTPSGKGYWLVAADGGIFSFGDARFFGSTGAMALNRPIVGMVPSPSGRGYLLVAEDGGIFTFGDADFHGSLGASGSPHPVVAVDVVP